jgi:UDP-N-acetylglucosamine--N-acetylmuramyl-(pentapeptide) pyrophosphoryl-undecaprenol N-acetylglucosamine transferase
MDRNRTVMLAAGGTGGHLFPAFALAEELGRRGYTVDLVTDMRGDRYGTGFPARAVHQVPSATLASKSPVAVAKTGLALAKGIVAARKLMKNVRPLVVVGFGGYPTFPPLLAARQLGIPTMLHEQNAVLGRANKMLARRVNAIATSFETTKFLEGSLLAKARFAGNPVRGIVLDAAAMGYPPLEPNGLFNLLVFGGSQGARYFSDAVPPALARLPPALKSRLNVVQQAREEDVVRVQTAYAEAGIASEIAPFFKDLPARMAASHLVVGRAGASSVAELTVIGRPSILVPLPHSLDNDQLQNATRLAESGGAWCIEQKTLSPERLADEIARLMESGAALREAAECARKQGRPDAVVRLASLVEELAGSATATAPTSARAS